MTSTSHNIAGDLCIEVADEEIVLLPERALWWPARRSLIVADVHFGKSSVFRSHGIAVPSGSTQDNLVRLTACLQRYPAERLLCLGDLTHGRSGRTPQLHAQLDTFRQRHASLHITLVRGNHDRHAGVPEALRAEVAEEPFVEGPFSFRHAPSSGETLGGLHYEFAGHIHPAIVLGDQHDRLRLPCFVFAQSSAILPAFGAFTGMYTLEMRHDVAYYPVADDRVLGPVTAPTSDWR